MADFTTREEIEHLFGEEGVDLRAGDADGETALARAIRWATNKMLSYLQPRYPRTQLEGNTWVTDQATLLAAHYLSKRKGNPALYQDDYQEILNDLREIRAGRMVIPEAATHSDYTPGLGNVVIDDRYGTAKARVQPATSSDDTHPDQYQDRYYYDWLDEI